MEIGSTRQLDRSLTTTTLGSAMRPDLLRIDHLTPTGTRRNQAERTEPAS